MNQIQKKEPLSMKERLLSYNKRKWQLLIICCLLLLVLMVVSLCLGSSGIPLSDTMQAILARLLPGLFPVVNETNYNIVWQLRLPRIFLAVIAGAGLSVSGAVMQALTRNPLVSPFTVGISNAAAFGASLAILLGASLFGSSQAAISAGAFICAVLCAVFVYFISNRKNGSTVRLILIGTAMTYLFSAMTNTIQYIINDEKLSSVLHWTFGSFSKATPSQALFLFGLLLVVMVIFMKNSWVLDAMSSGSDDVVKTLGIDVNKKRIILGLITVFLTACIISMCGVIGFVGIVGPHMARIATGAEHKFLIPFSAFTGGLLILVSDTAGRILFSPIVMPVGIVVAYVGVPIFLHLILSKKEMYFK